MIFAVHSKHFISRIHAKLVTNRSRYYIIRYRSSVGENFQIKIGNVSLTRSPPKFPELVPVNYNIQKLNHLQSILHHLKWIMQKDNLNQDIFLIGPPGSLKRTLAMLYLDITKKEVEYITLSRDTTESDIKQRREIKNKTAYYVDQCAVRAAVEGRILVLDGIEKAERNVLPILNNLLENREMQLEDGRFLMSSERYDKLLKTYSKQEMDKMKLVRVSENFRVIALGLPVPRYPGNPLDPPLRSRFQARDVNPLPFKEHLELLKSYIKSVPEEKLMSLLYASYTLHSPESKAMGLPDFPLDQLTALAQIMDNVPEINLHSLIHLAYPYDVFLGKDGQKSVIDVLKKFDIDAKENLPGESTLLHVQNYNEKETNINMAIICEESPSYKINYKVVTGKKKYAPHISKTNGSFVNTKSHRSLLAQMMHSHSIMDFCIVGPKGCGKTAVVQKFAEMLGYDTQPIMLYEDMSARDLLQQRITTSCGDTVWKFSPLVTAALTGQIAILDGLHRINPGTLAVVHRLVQDRELQLFSGVRLVRVDRFEQIKLLTQLSDQELSKRGILPIHPAFRLVALSEPPDVGSSSLQWLNAESLTLFLYHHMRPLSFEDEMEVINKVDKVNSEKMNKIVDFTHSIRNSQDPMLQSLASSLSTRQLLRIAKRVSLYENENVYDAIQKACLARFLPPLAKMALMRSIEDFDIHPPDFENNSIEALDKAFTCEIKNGRVRIGQVECDVYSPESTAQVPDVLFYDNLQHLKVMEDMLKDFLLGEHLLLVGNQGVGKNKIVDRFLHLLNRPREYIQLHRDTTVQSLTLQSTVQDGVIKYEDSPLVSAVKHGRILVIDEADKAPTNVTCILKTLVESGSMILADGRKIVNYSDGDFDSDPNVIRMHPDFRMIVLANRPGFPFLGNDFFGTLGDIFSCHAVDNPSMKSEISMLQKYGPSVPLPVIRRLVEAFSELRIMADQGLISYPYSTREIVNIVKHLQAYPEEGLASVVRNVFDFDPYSEEMWETLTKTLQKHGIPIGVDTSKINLAKEYPLPEIKYVSNWKMRRQSSNTQTKRAYLPIVRKTLHQKRLPDMRITTEQMDRIDSRTYHFTEEEFHWNLPIGEYNVILDVAVTKSGNQMKDVIHVATGNPIFLFSMKSLNRTIFSLPLHNVFHYTRGGYQPLIRLAPLSGNLEGQIILHEGISNKIFQIEPSTGRISQLTTESLLQATAKEISYRIQGIDRGYYRMCPELSDKNIIIFYQRNGNTLEIMDLNHNEAFNIIVPIKLKDVKLASFNEWLLFENNTDKKYILKLSDASTDISPRFYLIEENPLTRSISNVSLTGLNAKDLSQIVAQDISAPNRLYTTPGSFINVAVGFPDLESSIEVYSFLKEGKKLSEDQSSSNSVFLTEAGQIVSAVPKRNHPEYNSNDSKAGFQSYIEVIDLFEKKIRFIPIPESLSTPPYISWLSSISPSHVLIESMSNNGLVTVDAGGCVRLWETAIKNLKLSLEQWKNIRGFNEDSALKMTITEPDTNELEPKHGKIDPSNQPHVGGDTWAGGTGGRSTAGLGGVGGPYRLDVGHAVYQVPDHVKDRVPEEIKQAAREMGKRAYQEKLRQVHMSEYDGELYKQLLGGIKSHIQSLKVIIESLQAKQKERQWLKHQTFGDLDDTKLIDSLTGEKNIYKRRGDKEPELGRPLEKPKKLKLLVDVSGSMYRFNGHDGRLNRIMEAALLVMEAFEKYSNKFQYEIIGHSGDSYSIHFVKNGALPSNNKEKLDILKEMHAHSQFCISGDHTLEATIHATDTLAKEEADERFVIMLSDANLDRYGIQPRHLSRVLTANSDVNSFAIFIGSLGDQAIRLQKALPSGRGFVCLDTKLIPDILRQIFTYSILNK